MSLNHIIFKTVPQKQIPGDDAAGEFVLEKNLSVGSAQSGKHCRMLSLGLSDIS